MKWLLCNGLYDLPTCVCSSPNANLGDQTGKSPRCIWPCIPVFILRGEARERYGIEGSTAGDAMASCCCLPCVNCQTAAEIKGRGDDN